MANLDPTRVNEMFWLFSKVLPIYGEKAKTDKIFGIDFLQLVPDLSLTIADLCKKDLETFDLYCDFLLEAIAYMRKETDDQPDVDKDDLDLMPDMNKAISEFEKNAKPTKF